MANLSEKAKLVSNDTLARVYGEALVANQKYGSDDKFALSKQAVINYIELIWELRNG